VEEKFEEIIAKYDILKKLKNERIFGIQFSKEHGVIIYEMCDEYFAESLSKRECRELGKMFIEIAEFFENEKESNL